MGIFEENRNRVALFSIENGGLRKCQLGAACAITAHFDRRKEPCRIVLPTGAGKTALMMLASFQLSARRVLIITPSVAVRDQIAGHFRSLEVLKKRGVLPEDVPAPSVHVQSGHVVSEQAWCDLEIHDVVVATPNSVSAHIKQVATVPEGLFDLLIVDEAHHSAAPIYRRILDDLKDVPTLLLTATPYRNDGKLVAGYPAYSFSMKEALGDGILTPLRFSAVNPVEDVSDDLVLCRALNAKYTADKAAGKDYRVMVRTDSIQRAKDLEKVYETECSDLKLKRLDHNSSLKTVEKAITDLKAGDLDGLIAVDMFGEGFDFPDLKACALHTPHGSLATAVQFFGRFARDRGIAGDEALFFAIPDDYLKTDIGRLFEQDADWTTLVPNLADGAIQGIKDLEQAVEGVAEAYKKKDAGPIQPQHFDLPQYVQVFIGEKKNITTGNIPAPDRCSTLRSWSHAADNWLLSVFERQVSPEWIVGDALAELTYEFTFVCQEPIDATSAYLLIASSHRSDSYFRTVAKDLVGDRFRRPPMHVLSRLLRGISELNCPSIGKRRQDARNSGETYNTSSGRSTQKTVSAADVARYRRGHVSVVGKRDGSTVLIGYSPGAKIWGPDHLNILQFRKWCKANVGRMLDGSDSSTGTELDLLKSSEALSSWTEPIVFLDWGSTTKLATELLWHGKSSTSLYDTTFRLQSEDAAHCKFEFEVTALGETAKYSFDLSRAQWFAYEGPDDEPFMIGSKKIRVPLTAYWLENSPGVRLLDGSVIEGDAIYRHELLQDAALPADLATKVDWATAGINIENELQAPYNTSLHGYIESTYSGSTVLFKDHGAYEAADHIEISEHTDGSVEVRLYHCKASSSSQAGQRQQDLQEVLRQGFTSLRYVESPKVLLDHIKKRSKGTQTFISGNLADCERLLAKAASNEWKRSIVLVQPGLTTEYSDPIKRYLLHSIDAFQREGCDLHILSS